MTWADLHGRTWEENRLFSVLFELTYRCNLDCVFCYNDLSLRGRPLAVEQYRQTLSDLARMQVLQLILSGGEPLAHPGFFEIGSLARELGFVVRVKSNGHALRGDLVRRLKAEVDPFVVEVSLHGAHAGSHDRQTRVPGSFERLLANLAEMKAVGLRAKLNATLTRWNEDEVGEMYALADARNLRLDFEATVTPRDDGDASPLSLAATENGFRKLVLLQRARAATFSSASPPEALRPAPDGDLPRPSGSKHCGAGSAGLAVDPFGNVFPCVQWRTPAGNLHESGIREIWERSRTLQEVRELTPAVRQELARLGMDASSVLFCPGLAVQATGSPLALYPGVAERVRLVAELRSAESGNDR